MTIKTDGTAWSFGQNTWGMLGNNPSYPYASQSSPVQIGSLTSWSGISTGEKHTVAVRTDGTAWAWGEGGQGQLGINKTSDYASPRQIGSLTNWAKVGTGTIASFGITL